MKRLIIKVVPLIDIILSPFVFLSTCLLFFIRRMGIKRMKISKKIFMKIGIFPIIDHYYEPLFKTSKLKKSLREDRELPGINFNTCEQLNILEKFSYNHELISFPMDKTQNIEYYYNNGSFEVGDAEYLYNMIRFYKPHKIIEIGSGYSTLMVINAIKKNNEEDVNYKCEHICIEPYEMQWLEDIPVKLIRKKVEEIDKKIFKDLEKNDLLFIDSSHMIRPQGDVLFEYLEILPILKPGVLIHIHDIFTPKDYLDEWILKGVSFWNEQYLLEAFLSFNNKYKIIGALNFLKYNYFKELTNKCPIFKNNPNTEPGSFWIMRI